MITTHKDTTEEAANLINRRHVRLIGYSCLLFAFCLFSFWYYCDVVLLTYDKWQLAGLIFIAVGALFTIILQSVKYQHSIVHNISGIALILGGFVYFLGVCVQIKHDCYCHGCVDEFECGCGIFGADLIIFGTAIAVGVDILYNYLSFHRTRTIVFSTILLFGSFLLLINRFDGHLSSIKKVEETGWIFVAVGSLFSLILVGIVGTLTYNLYNGIMAFLLFVGAVLTLIGGIGGYTSSQYLDSFNGTVWIFYILVCVECAVLAVDVLTCKARDYQALK